MKKFTEKQKEFMLDYFFRKEDSEGYYGWKSIATALINDGCCIVAGRDKIWLGGIGNFINIEDAKNAFECSKYTFNSDEFLKSQWFKDIAKSRCNELNVMINVFQEERDELQSLIEQ